MLNASLHGFPADPPKINPQVQTVREREKVTFVCFSSKTPQWFFNDEKLPRNAIVSSLNSAKEHFLTIENVTIFNAGYYECEGKTESDENMRARGELKVIGMFKI